MFGVKDKPFIVQLSSPVYFRGIDSEASSLGDMYEGSITATINLENIPRVRMSQSYRLFINPQNHEPIRFIFNMGKNQNEIFTVELEDEEPKRCFYESILTEGLKITMRANIEKHDDKYPEEFFLSGHELFIPTSEGEGSWLSLLQMYKILEDKPGQKEYLGTLAMGMIGFLDEAMQTIELARPSIA